MKTPVSLFWSVLLLSVAHVAAQTVVNQSGTLSFTNPLIWSAGVPTSSTDAVINQSTTTTLNLNGSGNVASLTVGAADTLNVNLGSSLYIYGPSINNSGAINLFGGVGNNTFLNIAADTTLSGPGTLTLNYGGGGGNAYIYASGANHTLTNSSTIQGSGIMGNGTGLTLANSGTLNANQSGQLLVFNGTGGVNNTGTLQATNGGTLQLGNNITVANAGGSIAASGTGSTVNIDNATINGGTLTATSGGVVQTQGSATLNGVTINGNYLSDLGTNTYLTGTTTNNGNIQLNGGTGSNGILQIAGNTTLLGGTVTLNYEGGGGNAYIQQTGGSFTLTNSGTIQGAGIIGNGGLTLLNNGTVNANQNGQTLVLNPSAGTDVNHTLANNGTLEATNGATLQLGNSITVNNAGQSILASGSGSTVNIFNSTINGGTLTATGGGVLQTQSSAQLNGVTINGNYLSNLGTTTYLTGTTTNNGTIRLNGGTGYTTFLDIAGNTTLQGGTVTLNYAGGGGSEYIQQTGGSFTLTNNETIQGAGTIGNGGLTLINNGTINSNQAGQTLVLNGSNTNNGGVLANNATLEATNGATLQLGNSITVANAGQVITAAGAGSAVIIFNSTINGGALTATGGGVLQTQSSAYLNGVTINGNYLSDLGTSTYLTGTTINNGNIQVNGGSTTNTYLDIAGNTTLQGGTVTLNSTGAGGSEYIQQTGGSFTLTNNETIQGAGTIGNGGLTLINNGTINSNQAGQTLVLNGSNTDNGGVLANNGTLEATNGATLQLGNSITVANAGQVIAAAGAGSAVSIFNSTINGGALTATGGGVLQTQSSAYLNSVTINGNYLSDLGTSTYLTGTTTNNGNIQVNGGSGPNTFLQIAGNTTLQGGTVTLNYEGGGGNVYVQQFGGTVTLTNNETIQGAGVIGNGGLTVVNGAAGTLLANSAGNALLINGSGGITNSGTMQANAGSTLQVTSTLANFSGNTLTGGTYAVYGGPLATGTLQLNTLGTTGGEIVNNAASILLNGPIAQTLLVDANGLNALSNLAANSTAGSSLSVANGYNFTTAGGFSNAGTVHAASGGTFTASNGITGPTGTVQIDSGGTVSLAGGSTSSTTGTLTQNGTLALGSHNVTVSSSYTNANFGVGNGFNNHANVTGTGHILAAGNTALALTGSAVSGGTTTTPTLANFGNLHVGQSVTLNYAITNSGSSGPSVQGAIQTSVNGGNITDSRLSGTGVTASNFGPLNLGQSTSQYAITFTGTTAGALTAGQTIHFASNFDNVPSPTLTLGGGTAYQLASSNTLTTPVALGNVHVGGSLGTTLAITNTAANTGGYTETLGASVTGTSGAASTTGSVTGLGYGATSNAIGVNLNTSTAGAKTGSATVNLSSQAINGSGLGTTDLGSQTVTVTGTAYNLASSNTLAPISLVAHVGDGSGSVGQTLTLTNTAPAGAFSEGLDSSFGSFSAGLGNTLTPTLSGSITNLAAGQTDNSSMRVAISTATVGVFNGTVTVNQASNGAGTSGLGITALPSQQVAASGSVTAGIFNYATPTINTPQPINFGNVRVNSTVANQAISISNTAPVSQYTELLNGNVVSAPAPFTASGSFNGLAAGAPANTSISVGLNTGTAGHQLGSVVLGFVSDGTSIAYDGTSTPLQNHNVQVQGNVYQVAQPTITAVNLGATRVGGTLTGAVSVTNTQDASAVGYQEGLNAAVTSSNGLSAAGGSINNLLAGSTDNTHITVGLAANMAGLKSGTVTLGLQSNGTGTSGLGNLNLPDSTPIAVTGAVYQAAQASLLPTTVDLGTVRCGSVINTALAIGNVAPLTGGYTETLGASFGATSSGLSGTGSLTGLGAGAPASNALSVQYAAAAAGAYSGSATVNFNTEAINGSGLGKMAIGSQTVDFSGTVNAIANAKLLHTGACSFTSTGLYSGMLDFGIVTAGSGSLLTSLELLNNVNGPADFLSGSFDTSGLAGSMVAFGGNSAFNLGAQQGSFFYLTLNTDLAAGFFTANLFFNEASCNACQSDLALGRYDLTIQGTINPSGSPTPDGGSTCLLLGGSLGGLMLVRRLMRGQKN